MIPVGTKVQIKHYETNPSFWDSEGHMMRLMGQIGIISGHVGVNVGRYNLAGYSWTWRGSDLLLIDDINTRDPNYAFRIRKGK